MRSELAAVCLFAPANDRERADLKREMRLSSPIVLALAHSATRQPPSTRARTIAAARQDKVLIDFSDADVVASWQPVDDRIMGGSSTSRCVAVEDGSMPFEGQLVVEGGGFASARYFQPLQLPSDLEAFELEIASDGRMKSRPAPLAAMQRCRVSI